MILIFLSSPSTILLIGTFTVACLLYKCALSVKTLLREEELDEDHVIKDYSEVEYFTKVAVILFTIYLFVLLQFILRELDSFDNTNLVQSIGSFLTVFFQLFGFILDGHEKGKDAQERLKKINCERQERDINEIIEIYYKEKTPTFLRVFPDLPVYYMDDLKEYIKEYLDEEKVDADSVCKWLRKRVQRLEESDEFNKNNPWRRPLLF